MAKRYDPIMCMMVDEPTKAQDELLFYQLQFGSGKTEGAKLDESEMRSYAEALLERYGEKRVTVSRQGKIVATYFNRKARDVAPATQSYINTIVNESKANAEKFVRQAEQDDEVPENELKYVYKAYNEKFGYKFHDSASTLDKAIATTDGMFASAFGEYSKGAKFKKEKFLKELAGISDAEELAKRIQTLDNELKNNLERLDEAYNVASKDYYAARNEIRSIMDAFSREAFSLYKKLDKK